MKYIIIGGGSAGIAAAYTILENSKESSVQLFEASGIYGGRARTDSTSIPGLAFDKGCVYIQDPDNPENPWPAIATKLGFATVKDTTDYKLRIDLGNGYQTLGVGGVPAINSIRAVIDNDFDTSKLFPNKTVICKPLVLNQEAGFALATTHLGPFTESAEPWNYIAADRAREVTEEWGENLFVINGLGTLVKEYGERIKKIYSARFTETFKAIKTISYQKDSVTVTDTSGKKYSADACIVTVPVGVLRAGSITFEPALPQAYTTALNALRLGSYKKIAFRLTKTPADIKDNVNYYLYNKAPQGIWQCYRLNFFPKNVFVVHAAGDFAAALDGMIDDDVFNLFKATFTEAYNNEPVFVDKYGMTTWNNNNYALGAYSYTAPLGLNQADTTALDARKQMAKPIHNTLYFAGEAYNIKAYGTLHGAYIDGKDTAEEALKFLEGVSLKNTAVTYPT